MTKLNFVGNHLLAFMANILYRTRISDLCSGCLGFKKEVIETMEIDALGFDLEANIFTEIEKKGYVIREIPIHYRRRIAPPKLSSLRDGLKIGWVLIKKRFR